VVAANRVAVLRMWMPREPPASVDMAVPLANPDEEGGQQG
jgi:hypothetical protein